jgi:hypothetical protein
MKNTITANKLSILALLLLAACGGKRFTPSQSSVRSQASQGSSASDISGGAIPAASASPNGLPPMLQPCQVHFDSLSKVNISSAEVVLSGSGDFMSTGRIHQDIEVSFDSNLPNAQSCLNLAQQAFANGQEFDIACGINLTPTTSAQNVLRDIDCTK